MIKQEIIQRQSITVDEGTMGFHDYVDKKETLDSFIQRVTDKMNYIESFGKICSVHYPNEDSAIIMYIIDESKTVDSKIIDSCNMCTNSKIDDELTDRNDYSACSIGVCHDDNIRMMLYTGSKIDTRIEIEKWIDNVGWNPIGAYYPKYCPNCGREITENSKK